MKNGKQILYYVDDVNLPFFSKVTFGLTLLKDFISATSYNNFTSPPPNNKTRIKVEIHFRFFLRNL